MVVTETLPKLGFSMGTLCSGTDVPVLCMQAMLSALRDVWGIEAVSEHLFSCEKNYHKREFIKTLFPRLEHVYGDVMQMRKEKIWDHVARVRTQPRRCTWLVAGFPCVDVSALNAVRKDHRSVVGSGAKSTGGVFQGIADLLRDWAQVEVCILEKFLGLTAGGDLRACQDTLQSLGFLVVVWHVDAKDFGVPHSRPRLCPLCFRKSWLSRSGIADEDHFKATLLSTVSCFVGHDMLALDDFLLPEGDPNVQQQLCPAEPHQRKGVKRPRTLEPPKWVQQHIRRAELIGRGWWAMQLPTDTVELCPGRKPTSTARAGHAGHPWGQCALSGPSGDRCGARLPWRRCASLSPGTWSVQLRDAAHAALSGTPCTVRQRIWASHCTKRVLPKGPARQDSFILKPAAPEPGWECIQRSMWRCSHGMRRCQHMCELDHILRGSSLASADLSGCAQRHALDGTIGSDPESDANSGHFV